MTFIFILSRPINSQGREPNLRPFVNSNSSSNNNNKSSSNNNNKHPSTLACIGTSFLFFCFVLFLVVIETIEPYTLRPVWMTSTFIEGHSYFRKRKKKPSQIWIYCAATTFGSFMLIKIYSTRLIFKVRDFV